jgi:acylphosphatase
MTEASKIEARSVFVSGRVQRVGYRWAVAREAESIGVSGWVCNLLDGRVQALIVGEAEPIARMLDFMRTGPMTARVDALESVAVAPPARNSGFRVTEEPED